MNLYKRDELTAEHLPGRVIRKAVGKDGPSQSGKMTVGFATYSQASGPMTPHQHAEEVCYIVDARDGWFRFGPDPDQLGEPVPLEAGMVLHNPPLEWHVFETGENGFIEIIFIYGQVDNIRPEENQD